MDNAQNSIIVSFNNSMNSKESNIWLVKNDMNAEDILKKYLKQEKMCITQERLEIVRIATSFGDTFGVDELCEKMGETGIPMVPSTVYRNLKLFCAAGILEMVKTTADGKSKFRVINPKKVTCHLNCRRGNRERIIKHKELEKIILDICRENGFEEEGVTVKIEGIRKRRYFDTINQGNGSLTLPHLSGQCVASFHPACVSLSGQTIIKQGKINE